MKNSATQNSFNDEFRDMGRDNNFSYNGKLALFSYLEQLEEECDMEIELDVIALCCEYTEDTIASLLDQYNLDDVRQLEDRTTVIYVDDPPGKYFDLEEHGDITIIIQDF